MMLRMHEKLQAIQDSVLQRVLLCKFQHEDFSKRAKGFNANWIKHYQIPRWVL